MPARLIESLATTGPLADLFADQSLLQAMLDFEVGLARAEARLNLVYNYYCLNDSSPDYPITEECLWANWLPY